MISVKPVFSGLFNEDQRLEKGAKAVRLMSEALNREQFHTEIMKTEFTDTRWLTDKDVTSLLNASQIWNILSSGAEEGTNADNEWDLRLDLYKPKWPWSSAIGYTEAGTIHTTIKFFGSAEIEDIAAHWAHEWCHTAGFIHDFRDTARRGKSVPYAVGDIVARILSA
jgi:hypothetical protein